MRQTKQIDRWGHSGSVTYTMIVPTITAKKFSTEYKHCPTYPPANRQNVVIEGNIVLGKSFQNNTKSCLVHPNYYNRLKAAPEPEYKYLIPSVVV